MGRIIRWQVRVLNREHWPFAASWSTVGVYPMFRDAEIAVRAIAAFDDDCGPKEIRITGIVTDDLECDVAPKNAPDSDINQGHL